MSLLNGFFKPKSGKKFLFEQSQMIILALVFDNEPILSNMFFKQSWNLNFLVSQYTHFHSSDLQNYIR